MPHLAVQLCLQSYGWFGYVVPWQPHDHTLTIACTEHEGQVSTLGLTTSAIWTSRKKNKQTSESARKSRRRLL